MNEDLCTNPLCIERPEYVWVWKASGRTRHLCALCVQELLLIDLTHPVVGAARPQFAVSLLAV